MSARDIFPQEMQGICLHCLLEPELLHRWCFVPEERHIGKELFEQVKGCVGRAVPPSRRYPRWLVQGLC